MSNQTFLILLVAGAGTITILDVIDRIATRASRYGGERLRFGTFLFLALATAVFLGVQVGLTLLFPQALVILERVQAQFAAWVGSPASDDPIVGWRLVALTAVCFYVSGLFDYLAHRFFNHSKPFWWTHEYHHLPNEVFVIIPGLMVRPFAAFSTVVVQGGTVLLAYGIVLLCGWPLWDLLPALKILALVNMMILMTSHSAFLRRFWASHYLMRSLLLTTPQEHLIHHTTDRPGNYGNTTTLWDRLFRTYRDPALAENQNRPLGLDYDQDFLGVLTFGKLKLPQSWRERFQLHRYCNLDGASARIPT